MLTSALSETELDPTTPGRTQSEFKNCSHELLALHLLYVMFVKVENGTELRKKESLSVAKIKIVFFLNFVLSKRRFRKNKKSHEEISLKITILVAGGIDKNKVYIRFGNIKKQDSKTKSKVNNSKLVKLGNN